MSDPHDKAFNFIKRIAPKAKWIHDYSQSFFIVKCRVADPDGNGGILEIIADCNKSIIRIINPCVNEPVFLINEHSVDKRDLFSTLETILDRSENSEITQSFLDSLPDED